MTTSDPVSGHELEALRTRLSSLPYPTKCEIFEELRAELAADLAEESHAPHHHEA